MVVDVELELGNPSGFYERSLSLQQGLKHIRREECNVTMKCNCWAYAILCRWNNFVFSKSYYVLDTQAHAIAFLYFYF